VRAGAVAALLVAAAALGACKTYKSEPEKVPPGYEAGVFPPAPGREVFDDGGLIMGGGGAPGGGPVVVAGPDGGGARQDAAGGADLGGQPDSAGPVFGSDAGGCSLLAPQSCGQGAGCYPVSGQGRCQRSEPGSGEGVQCFENTNCAAGLICINMLCTPLCSLSQMTCASGVRCVPYPGYDGVGYCLP
jgi:hypothetical protein